MVNRLQSMTLAYWCLYTAEPTLLQVVSLSAAVHRVQLFTEYILDVCWPQQAQTQAHSAEKPAARKPCTFCQQQDVIKQIIGLWSRLQQGDHGGVVESVCLVPEELDNGIGGAAVQACADLVHEEDCLGTNHHFTCTYQHNLSA